MTEIKVDRNDFVYLLWCAVHDEMPDEKRFSDQNKMELFEACMQHKVSALAALAAEKTDFDEEVREAFREDRLNAIRLNILFLAETERLLGVLEQEGIAHIPLKGYELIKYYPQGLVRQMGDIDILADNSCKEKIHTIMLENGYNEKSYGLSHDDVYFREPFYKYEMHRMLFTEREKQWHDYYEDIFTRLKRAEGKNYRYYFTDEDFYIYYILHNVKHIRIAGSGIRSLLDIYYFLSNKKPDFSYIEKELEKLGVLREEKILRRLAMKIFSEKSAGRINELDNEEKEMLEALIRFGVYGSQENSYKIKISKMSEGKYDSGSKLKYITNRIFCIPEIYKVRCPALYKNRVTRPLIFFVRAFNGITVKRKKVIREFKVVISSEKEKEQKQPRNPAG